METINCNEIWTKTVLFHHIILFSIVILLLLSADDIIWVLGYLETCYFVHDAGERLGD